MRSRSEVEKRRLSKEAFKPLFFFFLLPLSFPILTSIFAPTLRTSRAAAFGAGDGAEAQGSGGGGSGASIVERERERRREKEESTSDANQSMARRKMRKTLHFFLLQFVSYSFFLSSSSSARRR